MTETKQPDDSFLIALTIACLFGIGVLVAGTEANKWTHGVVVVNDMYVHYDYHNYRGDLGYRVGADQPQVHLCRVYPYEYARCVRTKKESSLTPLSDFDALVLEKLYEDGVLKRKYTSIKYTHKTEVP